MFSKSRIAIAFVLVSTFVIALPVYAGGWAVITLDELPVNVVAGAPVEIGFKVLQHGRTPLNDLHPKITATLFKESQFIVNAEPDGKPGHYIAILNFPKEGDWYWSIQAFTMDQPMPVIKVASSNGVSIAWPDSKNDPISNSNSLVWIIRFLAVGVGLAGLVIALRRKGRLGVTLAVICLVAVAMTFVASSDVPNAEAQVNPLMPDVELGRQLFVAKGCITCHHNNKLENAYAYQTVDMGAPNLTKFSANPETLRMRLKDPASVKSDTQMPNLNLSESEIESLIAFLNSD